MDDRTLCVTCGGNKEPRQQLRCKSCQAEHRATLERERNRHRAKRPNRYWHRQCDNCGANYKTNKGRLLCELCRTMMRNAKSAPLLGPTVEDIGPMHGPRVPRLKDCGWCGRKTGRRTYCSDLCMRAVDGSSTDVAFNSCVECGETYCRPKFRNDGGFCSVRCNKRAKKRDRRHIKRTVMGGESFTLREIAERDGWRCHLCGGKVPDRKWTAKDKDPTIDHLVPVADGGKHTRANVALAHNRCNWERRDEGAAQLRLVG